MTLQVNFNFNPKYLSFDDLRSQIVQFLSKVNRSVQVILYSVDCVVHWQGPKEMT